MIETCIDCGAQFEKGERSYNAKRCSACVKKHRQEYIRRYFRERGGHEKISDKSKVLKIKFVGALPGYYDELECFIGNLFCKTGFMESVRAGYFNGGIIEVDGVRYVIKNCELING